MVGSASTSSRCLRRRSGTRRTAISVARWLLRLALWSLPLPWVAAELGWVVAEYGRQPWAIDGVLPTFLASSSVSAAQVLFTLCGFVLFYSSLLVVDIILMRKYIAHGTGQGAWACAAHRATAAVPAE